MTPARDPKQCFFFLSRKRHLGRCICEEASESGHLGGTWEEASGKRHLGGIWEVSGKHLGASGKHPEDLGGIWKASGKHLESIWEASGRHLGSIWRHLGGIRACGRHLGGIWETSGGIWEVSGRHLGGIHLRFSPLVWKHGIHFGNHQVVT